MLQTQRDSKKFSILIANYNNGQFFPSCYDSIIAQTYDNWEAVILDDKSTDDSIAQIKKIIGNDDRFKIYENDLNCGVGITKHKLIDFAEGDICGFLDPDDALLPDALKASIDVFDKKEKVVLTHSKYLKCDEYLNPVSVSKNTMPVQNNDPYFFNCNIHIAHFVAFRKKIYELTEKMDTSMKIAEDQDLYLKMYEMGEVFFINKPCYLYRIHSNGISQDKNLPAAREYFSKVLFNAMKRRNLKTINGKPVPDEYTDVKSMYDLLEYQNKITYRIRKKLNIFLQKILDI